MNIQKNSFIFEPSLTVKPLKTTDMKKLFENDYCIIVENTKGEWFRLDKILGTSMKVMSYFDKDGNFIAHQDR